MNKISKTSILKYLGVFLLGGAVTGVVLHFQALPPSAQIVQAYPVREKNSEYKFINPLLFYEVPESKEFNEYIPLNTKVETIIQKYARGAQAATASVYFRDLSKGRWIGIQENEGYVPASLLKVVLMIAYLKQGQETPGLLAKQYKYTPQIHEILSVLPYDSGTSLTVGAVYSIDELIRRMIIDSDNGAKDILLYHINEGSLNEVYGDLGLKNPGDSQYLISAHDYSSFFRILYNATYLNREMSERALSLLSKAEFKDGILSGINEPISVAHKFGEYVGTEGTEIHTIELHDCGIIYYPQRPYLLCVMTHGSNIATLKSLIRDISKAVYEEIKND